MLMHEVKLKSVKEIRQVRENAPDPDKYEADVVLVDTNTSEEYEVTLQHMLGSVSMVKQATTDYLFVKIGRTQVFGEHKSAPVVAY